MTQRQTAASPPTLLCLSAFVLALVVGLRAQSAEPAVWRNLAGKSAHGGTPRCSSIPTTACRATTTSRPPAARTCRSARLASTIMANAARDPYFHASVRRETIDHPAKSAEIQDECAACHVPIAQKMAHAEGRLAVILTEARSPSD